MVSGKPLDPLGFYRVRDIHDVVHLALGRAGDSVGIVLCGYQKTHGGEEIPRGGIAPPGMKLEGTLCPLCMAEVSVLE